MSLDNMITEYALRNYKKMFREPKGNLKYKFIVPGSVYDEELWDWDSWLANVALRQFVSDDISEYEKGCVLNFLEHIDEEGRIPIVIRPHEMGPNLSGKITNIHKPCLAQHAAFIIKQNEQFDWIRPYYSKLCAFVDYYIKNCRHALYPHSGAVAEGGTIEEANCLNIPAQVVAGAFKDARRIVRVSSDTVLIDAVKKAEDEACLIVRLHECRGGRGKVTLTSDYPMKSIVPCNLLEHDCGEAVAGASVEFVIKPFEIKTFKFYY